MHLLAEVRAARRGDAANGDRAALAEIDLVEIGLEDALLAVAPLDERGQPGLVDLAQQRALGIEQPILDELLRDRAAALGHAAGSQVDPRRPQQSAQIDARMIEEAVIFGGQHGLQQAEGHVAQPHRPVVLARPVAGARQDLGLERRGADVAALPRDANDALVAHVDPHALRAAQPRHSAQMDVPSAAVAPEMAGVGLAARFRVRQPCERSGQIRDFHVHADGERLRHRVHDGRAARLDTVEACQLDGRIDQQRHQRQADDAGQGDDDADPAPSLAEA
jgi:hypothetical protein